MRSYMRRSHVLYRSFLLKHLKFIESHGNEAKKISAGDTMMAIKDGDQEFVPSIPELGL